MIRHRTRRIVSVFVQGQAGMAMKTAKDKADTMPPTGTQGAGGAVQKIRFTVI